MTGERELSGEVTAASASGGEGHLRVRIEDGSTVWVAVPHELLKQIGPREPVRVYLDREGEVLGWFVPALGLGSRSKRSE